jgi:hypothetical protein
MDRMKRTGFVASAITQSLTHRFLPVGPSEVHSLLEESQHVGWALAFDSGDCNSNMIHAWNFSVYQEFFVSQGSVMQLN